MEAHEAVSQDTLMSFAARPMPRQCVRSQVCPFTVRVFVGSRWCLQPAKLDPLFQQHLTEQEKAAVAYVTGWEDTTLTELVEAIPRAILGAGLSPPTLSQAGVLPAPDSPAGLAVVASTTATEEVKPLQPSADPEKDAKAQPDICVPPQPTSVFPAPPKPTRVALSFVCQGPPGLVVRDVGFCSLPDAEGGKRWNNRTTLGELRYSPGDPVVVRAA